jgi:hypothetical protein
VSCGGSEEEDAVGSGVEIEKKLTSTIAEASAGRPVESVLTVDRIASTA